MESSPHDAEPFRPARGLGNRHLQTVLSTFNRPDLPYRATAIEVEVSDGDRIVVHEDCPDSWQSGDRCVILSHGLLGCYLSPYMVRFAHKLTERGYRCFRVDGRGFGAGLKLASQFMHAGRSKDLLAVIEAVSRRCPESPLTTVGVSLGGNITLKLAGEVGDAPPGTYDSAMAIAPPVDLKRCAMELKDGVNRFYDRYFVRQLLKHVATRLPYSPRLQALHRKPYPKTLYEFDDRYTAPLAGFRDAADYYEQASAERVMQNIRIATQVLSADDDPFIPGRILRPACELSSAIRLTLTRKGGHVGFYGMRDDAPDRHWMDWRVVEWVESLPRRQTTHPLARPSLAQPLTLDK